MDREQTWFKMYRSLLSWEWYGDKNVKILFLHLLLIVNIEDQRKQGVVVPAGSIDRTYEQLASECGLTIQQLKTAIRKLKSTGELTVVRHPKFSVFTMVTWLKYQEHQPKNNHKIKQRATEEQPKSNRLNKNNRIIESKKERIDADAPQEDDDDGWDEIGGEVIL